MAFAQGNLLWLDVETTGLDASNEHLLQVAALITDEEGNILTDDNFETVVYHDNPSELKKNAIPYVQDMHEKTGLWDKLSHGVPLEVVDDKLLGFMRSVSNEPRTLRLAGNSVRLDLNFMEKYLPSSYSHIHYRSVDVSALHWALSAWGVVDEHFPKKSTHNAIDDIKESLEEYKWLRMHVLDLPNQR